MLESRKLGAARMSALFVSTDPIEPEQRKALEKHYERELSPIFETIRRLKPIAVIGTSGTWKTSPRCATGMTTMDRSSTAADSTACSRH